jgi:GDPmannose 4,6-dehydratase
MQWLMLQQDHPEDFVIATGKQISVRQFIDTVAHRIGLQLQWQGTGVDEVGIVTHVDPRESRDEREEEKWRRLLGQTIVRIDPKYYRPTEVETLLGDPAKAKAKLGWSPKITVEEMVDEMVTHDLDQARRLSVLRQSGFEVALSTE